LIEAAFYTANRLFGLSSSNAKDIPLYHAEARSWIVFGRTARRIALFIGDYFARSSKRSGAWMSSFRDQHRLDGEVLPIIVNVLNFAKAGENDPAF